jgi:hypothetical protein
MIKFNKNKMGKTKQLFLTTSCEDAHKHTKAINDSLDKSEEATIGIHYAWHGNYGEFKHISYNGYNLLNKSQKAVIKKYVRNIVS